MPITAASGCGTHELGAKADAAKCWPPGHCPGTGSRNPKAARVGLRTQDSEDEGGERRDAEDGELGAPGPEVGEGRVMQELAVVAHLEVLVVGPDEGLHAAQRQAEERQACRHHHGAPHRAVPARTSNNARKLNTKKGCSRRYQHA